MVALSVVRLGPSDDNISAKLLRTALVSYFQQSSTSNSTSMSETVDEKSGSTMTISNKYFSANVILEDISSTSSSSSSTATLPQSKEDGIILVFDALHSNPDRPITSNNNTSNSNITTFDSLSMAHTQAETDHSAGDLLRLCVGVSMMPLTPEEIRGKHADKEYSRRILWCLDRGYEYVEADISQDGQAKGHDERDKEGFARIVEAIQGTVWSSAVMSKPKVKELEESYQAETKALQEPENPYIPPDPSNFKGFTTTTKEVNNNSLPSSLAEPTSSSKDVDISGLVLDPSTMGPEETAEVRKDLETEKLFEKMEGVIREATQIREASKNGTLSDEQRREKASEAAMALVNLMSQFGLEDDEEDGDELDSSDDDSGVVEN